MKNYDGGHNIQISLYIFSMSDRTVAVTIEQIISEIVILMDTARLLKMHAYIVQIHRILRRLVGGSLSSPTIPRNSFSSLLSS